MSERVRGAIELAGPGGGRLALDVSAGDGLSTRMLAGCGWRVITTEVKPRRAGWVGADLDDGLPFRSDAFDLVMMLEVIEHVADIPGALAEMARVIKPGGLAIVSTPNRLNAASRLHYLFTGFYKGRRAPMSYRYRIEDGRNWHIMGLNDFHWIAHGAGLRMEALGRSRRKLKSKLLAAMLYLPVAVSSYVLYARGVADPEQKRLNRELFRFMTSTSCLMDENIVMRFRRIPPVSGPGGT